MINIKKKLAIVFDKIILKLCTNTKNNTSRPLALEVLREEVQVVICIVVTLELKTILEKVVDSFFNKSKSHLFTDKIIKILIFSSKNKIISTLKLYPLTLETKLNRKNNWLLREIQIEEYIFYILILKQLRSAKNCTKNNRSNQLFTSLIENLIIKISDYIAYELFSCGKLTKKNCLKLYTKDFFIIPYNLISLRFYLYWRLYLESFYLNIKRFSTDKYKLTICTKTGFGIKKFHNKEISKEISSPKISKLLAECLICIDYLYNKRKVKTFR